MKLRASLAKERDSERAEHVLACRRFQSDLSSMAKERDSEREDLLKENATLKIDRDSALAHSEMLDSIVPPLEAKDPDALIKEGGLERAENLSEIDFLAKERDSERDGLLKEVARIAKERDSALARSEMLDSMVSPLETMRSEMKTLLVEAKDALLEAGAPKRQN